MDHPAHHDHGAMPLSDHESDAPHHDHAIHKHEHAMPPSEYSAREIAKFIFVIGIIMSLAQVAARWTDGWTWASYLRWFMAFFFIIFAGFKLAGYQMFAMMFAGYDVIAKRFKPYAYAYPFIELFLGILYAYDAIPTARDLITILVMAVSAIGVFQEVKKRSGIHCACLGNIIKLPLSTVSLIEDVGMGLMAIIMLIIR